MSEIILNGVSLTELKKTKAAIQKDASTFIADGIRDATVLIKSIVDADTDEPDDEIQATAQQATEILSNVALVSDVSGVTFHLPYSEDWGYGDDGDETPYSNQLDETGRVSWNLKDAVYGLYDALQHMEYNSKNWHSSTC